jgi:hypothetical protein
VTVDLFDPQVRHHLGTIARLADELLQRGLRAEHRELLTYLKNHLKDFMLIDPPLAKPKWTSGDVERWARALNVWQPPPVGVGGRAGPLVVG